jgi:hypothetical protein
MIPKRSGDRVKTNHHDAVTLVKLLPVGELRTIWVPDTIHDGCTGYGTNAQIDTASYVSSPIFRSVARRPTRSPRRHGPTAGGASGPRLRGLITSSTLVLCWMGRSAGLAPRRIFPTCPSLNRSRRRLRLRTMTGHHAHLRAVFAVKAATAASATAAATTTAASTATWDEPASDPCLSKSWGYPDTQMKIKIIYCWAPILRSWPRRGFWRKSLCNVSRGYGCGLTVRRAVKLMLGS